MRVVILITQKKSNTKFKKVNSLMKSEKITPVLLKDMDNQSTDFPHYPPCSNQIFWKTARQFRMKSMLHVKESFEFSSKFRVHLNCRAVFL